MPVPHLPNEIWLQILSNLPVSDIWLTIHPVSLQLAGCAEDAIKDWHFSKFTIALSFSLAAGAHHRWYDVRSSITFTFKAFSTHNPRYALFGSCIVHPQRCFDRAMEEWKRVTADGVRDDQEWRVQHGYRSEPRSVRLPSLGLADSAQGTAIWVDWREMLDAYWSPEAKPAVTLGPPAEQHMHHNCGQRDWLLQGADRNSKLVVAHAACDLVIDYNEDQGCNGTPPDPLTGRPRRSRPPRRSRRTDTTAETTVSAPTETE
ncbi:hypothetical protein LTR56_020377 [Elasticomyces elasticus]|nr:hypothetical protein LTR56_020377 [Elasticomyces elasticus]KAK3633101.1 hypothetical protein LTR22_020299 [Elasticomyces elasticus]